MNTKLTALRETYQKLEKLLFPEINIYARQFPGWLPPIAALGIAAIVYFPISWVFPQADEFWAFDFFWFFGRGNWPPFFPPWIPYYFQFVNYHMLVAITLSSTSVASFLRARTPLAVAPPLLTLQLSWVLFLGQLDGISLFGLLGLPWLIPFALTKPQIATMATAAKRNHLLVAITFLLLSFIIWGPWPFTFNQLYWSLGTYPQDIAFFLWGVPVAAVLLWFSRGDMDMIMAGGSFLSPHLIPFNWLVIAPALARLPTWVAYTGAALSWLPVIVANTGAVWGWWLGWLFPMWIWGWLAWQRYTKTKPDSPQTKPNPAPPRNSL